MCRLLTASANSVLEPIHDRTPVIIRREDWPEWFSSGELAEQSFQRIMTPYRAEEISALAVSPLVNSARWNNPRCGKADYSSTGIAETHDNTQGTGEAGWTADVWVLIRETKAAPPNLC